jgi:hypothetical protein
MNPSSPMDNLELVSFDLNCPVVINSPSLTKIDQECFPTVCGLFIETSCSKILLIFSSLLTMSMF